MDLVADMRKKNKKKNNAKAREMNKKKWGESNLNNLT